MLLSMRCWPTGKEKPKYKTQPGVWCFLESKYLVSESSEPGFQLLATHIRAGFLCRAV